MTGMTNPPLDVFTDVFTVQHGHVLVCVSEVKGSGRSALLVSFVILNPAAVVAPPSRTYVMLFRSAGIRVQTKASTVAPNPPRHGCFCSPPLNTLTFKWTLHHHPHLLNKRLTKHSTSRAAQLTSKTLLQYVTSQFANCTRFLETEYPVIIKWRLMFCSSCLVLCKIEVYS